MAKPIQTITPDNRVERWKKLWGKPRLLDDAETEAVFDEFREALVPSHMHKKFMKTFGVPKAEFGNRFFMEEAAFHNWDTRLSALVGTDGDHAEVVVLYGSPDQLEGHWLRGERRRSLRDIVIDDWQAACAIVRTDRMTLYVFVEPKMRGCIVKSVQGEASAETPVEAEPEEPAPDEGSP